MLSDLSSKKWIVAKGVMFLVLILMTAALLLQSPTWLTLFLVLVIVWASARFYYFLFYVLQHYIDNRLKYSGILDMLRIIIKKR